MFRFCPFLRMAAVCNNLAFGRVDEKSDIDVFVVAKSGRLFFVRTFLTGFLHFLGVRRYGNKVAGRFCLSFFIDDDFLDLSKVAIEDDIYLAYWLKTMLPIFDDGASVELIEKNRWARRFFENEEDFEICRDRVFGGVFFPGRVLEWIFGGWLGDFIEKKLKNWQLNRAKEKIKNFNNSDLGLVVDDHILKFHNVDRRRQWRNEWIKKHGEAKVMDRHFLSM